MTWKRYCAHALMCVILTSALTGCASQTALPATPPLAVSPALLHPCPPPPPLTDSTAGEALRGYLREVRAHRHCRERHAALAAALKKLQEMRKAKKPERPNLITDWY